MERVRILDCTLRDGGYVNHFRFGYDVIKDIINKLEKASVDIVECGFLQRGEYAKDATVFSSVEQIGNVIGNKNPKIDYVAMIQYGKISAQDIPAYDGSSVDGIRISFHESEIDGALSMGDDLQKKGYKVFMQAVGTTTYTDQALLTLVLKINELKPYAFYLVDTLGTMYVNDLLRMYYLVDNNLNPNIVLGFHAHNNLQLAFANAQQLIQMNSPRQLIIDSSVFGMGRGAGNLNTEFLTHYINTSFGLRYDNAQILAIIDEYIRPLSSIYRWGYDAAYYLAAIHKCHPNYASFLLNRQTLHARDMDTILASLDEKQRGLFDEKYIEEKYRTYLSRQVDDSACISKYREMIGDRAVLAVAPGNSLSSSSDLIRKFAEEHDLFVISVNFIPDNIPVNAVFVSNMKRFNSMAALCEEYSASVNIVVTSNITTETSVPVDVLNYAGYLCEEPSISDNAGMMCLNFLRTLGVKNLYLAGFDGFKAGSLENYYKTKLFVKVEDESLLKMNTAISEKLKQLRRQMEIQPLTDSIYFIDN